MASHFLRQNENEAQYRSPIRWKNTKFRVNDQPVQIYQSINKWLGIHMQILIEGLQKITDLIHSRELLKLLFLCLCYLILEVSLLIEIIEFALWIYMSLIFLGIFKHLGVNHLGNSVNDREVGILSITCAFR